ncbi:MAG TPA: DNA alkylation repair protein, partial [Anaerolineales bacterium]|nr:DNA alkylation repair protein [Anaerolineales bacterium]
MPAKRNAAEFLKKLKALRSDKVIQSHSHLASDQDDVILGVRMGQVFALAREFMETPLDEVERMLESRIHEMRVGAVSIMDFQARSKKTTEARQKELFEL